MISYSVGKVLEISRQQSFVEKRAEAGQLETKIRNGH